MYMSIDLNPYPPGVQEKTTRVNLDVEAAGECGGGTGSGVETGWKFWKKKVVTG